MAKGTVKWFNADKRYISILTDRGEDVAVHYSAILKGRLATLEEGQRVEFDVTRRADGQLAVRDVRVLTRRSNDHDDANSTGGKMISSASSKDGNKEAGWIRELVQSRSPQELQRANDPTSRLAKLRERAAIAEGEKRIRLLADLGIAIADLHLRTGPAFEERLAPLTDEVLAEGVAVLREAKNGLDTRDPRATDVRLRLGLFLTLRYMVRGGDDADQEDAIEIFQEVLYDPLSREWDREVAHLVLGYLLLFTTIPQWMRSSTPLDFSTLMRIPNLADYLRTGPKLDAAIEHLAHAALSQTLPEGPREAAAVMLPMARLLRALNTDVHPDLSTLIDLLGQALSRPSAPALAELTAMRTWLVEYKGHEDTIAALQSELVNVDGIHHHHDALQNETEVLHLHDRFTRVKNLSDALIRTRWSTDTLPVTIYLEDDADAQGMEEAVRHVLDKSELEIAVEFPPVHGSWFKRLVARVRYEAADTGLEGIGRKAIRAAELAQVDKRQAEVNATNLDAVANLIDKLEKTTAAVIQIGSVLLVKTHQGVLIRELTLDELRYLEANPRLLHSPTDAAKAFDHYQASSAIEDGTSSTSLAHDM
ncbi:cold-shock protein [Streptosporangiaceae bacterium NEAU-GS5]|nr:cold-shock protein [Streptosporangiaceae bacterium NEAU-GS5]